MTVSIQRKKQRQPELPPHSDESEQACLGCVLSMTQSQSEVESLLGQLKPVLFYDLRHRNLLIEMQRMKADGHALDMVTLTTWLTGHEKVQDCGGLEYIAQLPDKTPSAIMFSSYLDTLRELHHRRWLLQTAVDLKERATSAKLNLEDTTQWLDALSDATAKVAQKRPTLRIWKAKELVEYKIPEHLKLVGDNEISMGYDGVAVLAGPGSSGKSLCVMSLALAGAIGSGTWMGRTVHRRFKTLIIQAENGSVRLKGEIEAMQKNHPNVDIDGHIFVSEPPEGGIPFHNSDFRTAVRRAVLDLGVSLVVVAPWSQVAADDASKEVIETIGTIRSCFPAGDDCPGLLIAAHTRKPRPEDVRRGRGLTTLVSGSIALPNTARTVFVLLPWSDDITDDRIYWSVPKINNGANYAPSVWHRRFGTFFEHDDTTDPTEWGKDDSAENAAEERRVVKYEHLVEVFKDTPGMRRSPLVKAILGVCQKRGIAVGESTVFRAIGNEGYLRPYLTEAAGIFGLNKKEEKKK